MIIVTAGYKYLDIDAYAGCVAYAELLRAQGEDAIAYSAAPWNDSISKSIRDWGPRFNDKPNVKPSDKFVLIDISESKYFDHMVVESQVSEVIDHHLGFENYWLQMIGDKADIEFIGAACTLVYERWVKSGMIDQMSQTSARLLASGILDNTLNLRADVTTDRDRQAYAQLMLRSGLNDYWPKIYFAECTASIVNDIDNALSNDYKPVDYKTYPRTITVGQMAVWDGSEILEHHTTELEQWFVRNNYDDWFMSVISVGDGQSYFLAKQPEVKGWLSNLLNVKFDGDVAVASRMWLRKEIFKQDLNS